MSLIESLRAARDSPATALHEFLSKYNPALRRVHIFVEGSEDGTFYAFHFQRFVPSAHKVFTYACGNKNGVYGVHANIRARQLNTRDVYWCVDKDFSDLIPEEWIGDPQLFVTDVYSIENYFVTEQAVTHVVTALFKVRGVSLSVERILERYRASLDGFHFYLVSVMAVILNARRCGGRPNLGNLAVGHLLAFTDELLIRPRRRRYLYVATNTGIGTVGWPEIAAVARELRRLTPKRYVRGKCELWFLITFLKELRKALNADASTNGGEVNWLVPLEMSNVIAALTPIIDIPSALHTFLSRHYPQQESL
jgi:Protein of unknown function (DUF4435)